MQALDEDTVYDMTAAIFDHADEISAENAKGAELSLEKMVDHSCDEATEESMREVIMGVKGVKGIDLLQTRLFGSKMYVDIEISADGEIPLNEAHDVAENVHHTIEKNFKDVKHCMVHVNPVNE